MSDLKLGEPVTISDYLVRVSMSPLQAVEVAEDWEEFPPKLLAEATRIVERDGGARSARNIGGGGRLRVWVPASVQAVAFRKYNRHMRIEHRHHPAPLWRAEDFPLSGIVTRAVQIQDGEAEREEFGAYFVGFDNRPGYEVTYHLGRRAHRVLPSMIAREADA